MTTISCLIRNGLLAVVLVVSLGACDKAKTADPPAAVDTTDTGGSPEMEGSGPEKPLPPDDDKSVSLPNLPAGEDTYDSSETHQCLTAKWLGDEIPDGVSVQVKAVRITPQDVFTFTHDGCEGVTACTNSFTFTSADKPCSVSLDATAENGTKAYLRLTGSCASRDKRQCDELLADDGSPIRLYQPMADDDAPSADVPSSEDEPPVDDSIPPEDNPPPSTG